MEILSPIESWQTIRKYTDTPIDKQVLERILEAGRKAPSAKNRQPWRFIVVQDKDQKKRLQTAAFGQEQVGQAPVVIAACTTNIDYRMPNGQLSYPIDITFAVSFMMLQAVSEGLGTCVVTTYDEQEIKEILTVPYSMRVVMLLLIGHPAEEPLVQQRKPKSRVFGRDHW